MNRKGIDCADNNEDFYACCTKDLPCESNNSWCKHGPMTEGPWKILVMESITLKLVNFKSSQVILVFQELIS